MSNQDVVTLWRPVGPRELELIRKADMRAFPPRLPDQPIFYPVLSEDYAAKIARDWNVPASTPLGQDLASEAADLEQVNSMALNTSVIDNSTGASNTTALSGDCGGYGVTLNWTPGE